MHAGAQGVRWSPIHLIGGNDIKVLLNRYVVNVQGDVEAVGHRTIHMPYAPQVGWVIAMGPDYKVKIIDVQYVVNSGDLVAILEPIKLSDSSSLATVIDKLRARSFKIKNHDGTPLGPQAASG